MAITTLSLKNQKFTHIVQVSDIHIRLTKRHDEYKEVFGRLFESIKKLPDTTAIFVLGDIVNSKIDLSPECVDLAASLLRELASIRPTILIAGNHDTNLTNKNRMDSLSPIVDALKHPNLFYLKKSGLYGFGNICINNYSVFDSPDTYIKGQNIPKIYRNQYEYFIALYHGAVDGATTDLGFKLTNPTITTTLFNNHDIVLLGDIHKEQDLQSYSETKPIIRYSGSLIQQKHDETLKKHGYSFWDLKNRSYKQIDIDNDYGFYTILLDNGYISDKLTSIPTKARIRFQLKNTMPSQVKKALADITKITNVIECSYQKIDTGVALTRIPTTNGNMVLGDIHDVQYQAKLIKEYVKTKFKIEDVEFIEQLIEINKQTNDFIKKDDVSKNIRWLPIKFEWENMFSYGEKNVIDFTKLKDIIGLFAANTSGKSSIFSAMTFCLFDKCEREYKAQNILNIQKTDFYCQFEFEIDKIRYFIRRDGKCDKKGKVKVDVLFYKIENNQKIDLNGEQRKNTNEIIREYIGSYDDFILTSLSVQNGKNNVSIVDMGDTDRKDLFAQFMGLTVFDRLHTVANEILREKLVTLKNYRNENYEQKINECSNFISHAEGMYADELLSSTSILKEIDEKREYILSKTKNLVKLDKSIPSLIISQNKLVELEKSFGSLRKQTDITETELIRLAESLVKLDLDIKKMEGNENSLTGNLVITSYQAYQDSLLKEKEIQNQLNKLKSKYDADILIIEKSKQLKYDPECSYCFENAGNLASESKIAMKNSSKTKDEILILIEKHTDIKKTIDELTWSVNAYVKYQKLIKTSHELQDQQLQYTKKLYISKKNLQDCENFIKVEQNNIVLYNQNKDNIEYNASINIEIDVEKKLLETFEQLYRSKNKKLMDINGKLSVCKNQIKELSESIDKIKITEKEYKLYDVYCQCVSRDGIPFEVITATVPEVQNEVNNILAQIADFTSLFETDGKNIIPYIVYNDKKWLMSLTSGFEKFALSLAIRVALINISNLPRPNFLIIDEGFGVLDSENITSMNTLFEYLKTNFDFVMIVSHLDSLRDMVDKHIEIIKDNGYSKVNFV